MRPITGMVEKPEANCVVLLGPTASGKRVTNSSPWTIVKVDEAVYRKLRPGDEPPQVGEEFVSAKAACARIGLGSHALVQKKQEYQKLLEKRGFSPANGEVELRGITFCDLEGDI